MLNALTEEIKIHTWKLQNKSLSTIQHTSSPN